MTELHVLRVFLGPDGGGGNPLGVFLDGRAIAPERRLAVAHELGFSETVFVDSIEADIAPDRRSSRRGPSSRSPGTPRSARRGCCAGPGTPVGILRVTAGDVVVPGRTASVAWIRARAAWVHDFPIRSPGDRRRTWTPWCRP